MLLVDAKGLGASAAALVAGYAQHRADVTLAGLIFNAVGSEAHRRILSEACAPLGIPILGFLPRDPALTLPERHLGLVQAAEHPALEDFLARAAVWAAAQLDLEMLQQLARPGIVGSSARASALPPLGQHIAVARDRAFAFLYPATIEGWRKQGATLSFFSPLADEAPEESADAVYLPGGYPELHAAALSAAAGFGAGLRAAAARGVTIYGECGGYLVLGRGLVDASGERHAMTDLLPIESSFATPRRTLGYREATLASDGPLGRRGQRFRGHEFHFVEARPPDDREPLFSARDSRGRDLGPSGARRGAVMGSFLHLIDTWT
ncbi:MAG: cobyrinate a,c-diamide synthase [Burkholderiales bacterium]